MLNRVLVSSSVKSLVYVSNLGTPGTDPLSHCQDLEQLQWILVLFEDSQAEYLSICLRDESDCCGIKKQIEAFTITPLVPYHKTAVTESEQNHKTAVTESEQNHKTAVTESEQNHKTAVTESEQNHKTAVTESEQKCCRLMCMILYCTAFKTTLN